MWKRLPSSFFLFLFLAFLGSPAEAVSTASTKPKAVLVFSLTKSYRHTSIPEGIEAVAELGKKHQFRVDTTQQPAFFTKENLQRYRVIIFLNPTGSSIFNEEQKEAFQWYIRQGGGFVGIHAAADSNYEWEWYGKMVGAYFESHPKVQKAVLRRTSGSHSLKKRLPLFWEHTDEWYNFKFFNPKVKVLLKVDENSYAGGNMKGDHPISWFHSYDGGRAFYTGLGHTQACYKEAVFLQHLWNGIKWAGRF